MDKVESNNIKNYLKKYNDKNTISIFELSKLFQKRLSNLKKDSALKLSRYFVESRENSEVNYNEFNEETAGKVFKKLYEILDKCNCINSEEMLKLCDSLDEVNFFLMNRNLEITKIN